MAAEPHHDLDALLALDAAAWQADLDQLYEALERLHPDPFRQLSRSALRRAWQQRRAALGSAALAPLARHARLTELIKLPALLGDGHTRVIGTDGPGGIDDLLPRLPIDVHWYEDGLFVHAAHPDWCQLVGTRVTRVGSASWVAALDELTALVSRENVWRARAVAPRLLTRVPLLHGLGIAEPGPAVAAEIGGAAVQLPVLAPEPGGPAWECVRSDERSTLERSTLDRWDASLSTFALDDDVFVMKYDRVRDEPDATLADRFAAAFAELDDSGASRLVVDLRHNSGGDGRLNWPLVYGIRERPHINRRGRLFVLIGRGTFSAAMHCLTALERHTSLICVGEPTGTSPNHFGDAVEIRLEHTGLAVGISSLWWQESLPFDTRSAVVPELAVSYRIDDYLARRDVALEAVAQRSERT
jgi:hypothetical protein